MSNITVNKEKAIGTGLNIHQLKQSEYFGGGEYKKLLEENKGSLTEAYGDEVDGIFLIAIESLSPNDIQTAILKLFQDKLNVIENNIDPERLKFTITKAMDNEICINRKATSGGRVKIIINDDGVVTFSFLPTKENEKQSVLNFYNIENADFELLALSFLSY